MYLPKLYQKYIKAGLLSIALIQLTTVLPCFAEARLTNISTRAKVGTGDEVLIGGFVISGTENKTVLIRALGLSLVESGVDGVLANPSIKLFGNSGVVDENDNWQEHSRALEIPENLKPRDSNEAAILVTLSPGAYTGIVRGVGATTGVALVEVYEIGTDDSTQLINISTRGRVGVGDEVMIGGLVITGNEPKTVAIRALGISLFNSGLDTVLGDPSIKLFSNEGAIGENDNHQNDIFASFVPENLIATDDRESVIIRTLDPGAYTVVVRAGANGGQGVALVEVYDIEPDAEPDMQAVGDTSLSTLDDLSGDVIEIEKQPQHGRVVLLEEGYQYQPEMGYSGTDSFSYFIKVDGARLRQRVNFSVETALDSISFFDNNFKQCILGSGVEFVSELINLECSDMQIESIEGVSQLTALKSLKLSGNSVSTLDFINNSLSKLDIANNPISCEQLDSLQELAPNITLITEIICQNEVAKDIELFGQPFDSAIHEASNRFFVSLPEEKEIVIISLTSLKIVKRIQLQGKPFGIDLSEDGSKLYVALNKSNTVAVVNTGTFAIEYIGLLNELDDTKTYDVIEVELNRIFVVGNGGTTGASFVAEVVLGETNVIKRFKDYAIYRDVPRFLLSPDRSVLYINDSNSLYKYDLQGAEPTLILAETNAASGANRKVLNKGGTKILAGAGEILDTSTFRRVASYPQNSIAGIAAVSSENEFLVTAHLESRIDFIDFDTLEPNRTVDIGCNDNSGTRGIHIFDGNKSFAFLNFNSACISINKNENLEPDQFLEFKFKDLALEECVINEVQLKGNTTPEDVEELDCSNSETPIQYLDGIERLTNLKVLNISNSQITDLRPLTFLRKLEEVHAISSRFSNIERGLSASQLGQLDIRGNQFVNCEVIDTLIDQGVIVESDFCVQASSVDFEAEAFDLVVDETSNRVFVTLPDQQAIKVFDLSNLNLIDTWSVTGNPKGIDLSSDKRTLYVALDNIGSVAYLDTSTGEEVVVDLLLELIGSNTYDVAELSQGRILVSTAEQRSSDLSRLAVASGDNGEVTSRAGGDLDTGKEPLIEVDKVGQVAYLLEQNVDPTIDLYKLDASKSNIPLINSTVSFQDFSKTLSLDATHNKLFLSSGTILDADTFFVTGRLPEGISNIAKDSNQIYIRRGAIEAYELSSLVQVASISPGCPNKGRDLAVKEIAGGAVLLNELSICLFRSVAR